MKKMVYRVWARDFYGSVRELIDELITTYPIFIVFHADLKRTTYGVFSAPEVNRLDYKRPVHVLTRDCGPDKIEKDAYVLIRAFEHPYTSDLFRGTMCLYENVKCALDNTEPIRVIPFVRSPVELEPLKHENCLTYPYVTYHTFTSVIKGIMDEATKSIDDISVLCRLIREIYVSDVLHEFGDV